MIPSRVMSVAASVVTASDAGQLPSGAAVCSSTYTAVPADWASASRSDSTVDVGGASAASLCGGSMLTKVGTLLTDAAAATSGSDPMCHRLLEPPRPGAGTCLRGGRRQCDHGEGVGHCVRCDTCRDAGPCETGLPRPAQRYRRTAILLAHPVIVAKQRSTTRELDQVRA